MQKIIIAAIAVALSSAFFVAYAEKEKAEAASKTPTAVSEEAAKTVDKSAFPSNEDKKEEAKTEEKKPKIITSKLVTLAPLKTDFVLGERKAPLVLVEYASLSCPHCAHFSKNVLPELEKKYIETGKMAYVLRQFPLNEPALRGAQLLHCVGKKSEKDYYKFASVLFAAQEKWAFDANFLQGLQSFAKVGGFGEEAFKECMGNLELEKQLIAAKKQTDDEIKLGGTPYVIIGNEVYEGAHNIEAISAFIDAKLAKAKK